MRVLTPPKQKNESNQRFQFRGEDTRISFTNLDTSPSCAAENNTNPKDEVSKVG